MDSLPASGSGRMLVTLVPLGDKIKMTVTGKVFCERQGTEMRKSFTYTVDDCAWLSSGIFADRQDKRRFLKKGVTEKRVVAISSWFDRCDKIC